MTPLELLNEGIAKNDMELVRQAQQLMSQSSEQPISNDVQTLIKPTKRKYTKKEKNSGQKRQSRGAGGDVLLFKNDEEYFTYLYELERQHERDIASGKAGSLVGDSPISIDYEGACNDIYDEIDKKKTKKWAKEGKRASKRPPVQFKKVTCPKCGKPSEIRVDEYKLYNWDINNTESQLMLWSCGCLGK